MPEMVWRRVRISGQRHMVSVEKSRYNSENGGCEKFFSLDTSGIRRVLGGRHVIPLPRRRSSGQNRS